jgi:hypothetical protein
VSLHGKIKLNTDTLAEWEIVRVAPLTVPTSDDEVCTYKCVYRRSGVFALLCEPLQFELQHRYGDGGSKLISLMLARVAELEEATV